MKLRETPISHTENAERLRVADSSVTIVTVVVVELEQYQLKSIIIL